MATIYRHTGKDLYKDEADAYTPEEIRQHYAQFDRTLLQATYTVTPPPEEGGERVVEFAKKTGTKGGFTRQVGDILLAAPIPECEAVLAELDEVDPDALELEMAITEADEMSARCAKVVMRCLYLPPVPCPVQPIGF